MKKKIMRHICAGVMSAGLVLLPAGVAFTSVAPVAVMAKEAADDYFDGDTSGYVDNSMPSTLKEQEDFRGAVGTLFSEDGIIYGQEGPVIIKQLEDVTVNYPEGCTFHVEVENPDEVESYQWVMQDIIGQYFFLEGITAQTDTLKVPSTKQNGNALRFFCIVKGKNGISTRSASAHLTQANAGENKPVLYMEEYAIEPGQTLDLSTIDVGDGHKLGSGIIEFKENATDIVITDLNFDNTYTTAGHVLAKNLGFSVACTSTDKKEYNVTFNGDNRINNTYYDEKNNLSGIPFDFYFNGEGEKPLVNLKGDGKLTVKNGTYAIRAIGDLNIGIDIDVLQSTQMQYGDAIVANNIKVSEGTKLNLQSNGSGLYSYGDIYLQNADVTINANVPHVGKGITTKNFVKASGDIHIDGSILNLTFTADPDICDRTGGSTGITATDELKISNNSNVSVKGIVNPADKLYAAALSGIVATAGASIDRSGITIDMECDPAYNVQGFNATNLSSNYGDISVNVNGNGLVYGLNTKEELNVQDSNIEVNVNHLTDYKDSGGAYGIVAGNAVINITMPELAVSSTVNDGQAFGCITGDTEKTPA